VESELRSFSYVLRREHTGFTEDELERWWQTLHPDRLGVRTGSWTQAIPSGKGRRRRQTAWYVRAPCTCTYEYGRTHQPVVMDATFRATVEEITLRVAEILGVQPLNSVNLNFYEPGGGYAFHADDEALFDGMNRDARIISLSLAAAPHDERPATALDATGAKKRTQPGQRWFEVKRRRTWGAPQHAVELHRGDIMTMEGHFQRYFLHSVWPGDAHLLSGKDRSAFGERVNLSWRSIVKHQSRCPCAMRYGC